MRTLLTLLLLAGSALGQAAPKEYVPYLSMAKMYATEVAVKASGIAAVVAESCDSNFLRKSLNVGLPVVPCPNLSDNQTGLRSTSPGSSG